MSNPANLAPLAGRRDCHCGAVITDASDPAQAARVEEIVPYGCGCHPDGEAYYQPQEESPQGTRLQTMDSGTATVVADPPPTNTDDPA